MNRINLLPENVANQIAAGEVVGRPASVVKELMENAVDAGSTSVTVRYRDGGKESIQVIDNGVGMSDGDALLAFERHATSKIKGADDLYRLASFGFRGEALPSIASVAEVELRTKNEGAELGTRVVINGGRFGGQAAENTPQGAQFIVKNLFYNTPARRRFLKETAVEARHIIAEFQKVALCNPQVSFALYNGDVQEYNLPAANLRQRIVGVVSRTNRNIANNLLDVSVDTSLVTLEGFVGRPAAAKKNNKEQFFFINGRYFRSPYFHKAVMQAYSKLIPDDVQPSYFIYLKVDPERIDVNVHPQKTEIKFDDEQALWQIINAAVRESLGKLGVVPMMDFEIDSSMDIPVYKPGTSYKIPDIGVNPDFNPFKYDSASVGSAAGARAIAAMPRLGDFDEIDSSVLDFISGSGEEYIEVQGTLDVDDVSFKGALNLGNRIVTTFRGALTIIDLQRACERVLYERYMKMVGNNSSVSQQLLFPELLEFSPEDYSVFDQIADELDSMGFDFDVVEGNKVEFRGLPTDIEVGRLEQTLQNIFDGIKEAVAVGENERIERLAAIMAHESAAGTRRIGEQEAEILLEELAASANFNYTPSGHPVMTVLTDEEITKRFL